MEINYDYEIGKFPVTEVEWDTERGLPPGKGDTLEKGGLLPKTEVSWIDCITWCLEITELKKDGYLYRLPTEYEWEKAARGTDGRTYPWGNEFDKNQCNCYESKINKPTPVDYYSNRVSTIPLGVSPYNCFDMVGNIWEWCQNLWFNGESSRVVRGGSWYDDRESVRCSYRNYLVPGVRISYLGFRLLRIKII
jgi:formylglycine-generating enzyme required for sulfatase activity